MALSQAIQAVVISKGDYSSVVKGARVRQPVVSLALHQRLVVRTKAVERLFEFLRLSRPSRGKHRRPPQARAAPLDDSTRKERLLGLLDGLSDGSEAADRRLAGMLAALHQFSSTD